MTGVVFSLVGHWTVFFPFFKIDSDVFTTFQLYTDNSRRWLCGVLSQIDAFYMTVDKMNVISTAYRE